MCEVKAWLKNEKGVEVISLTDSRLEEALALMRDSYYPDESAAKGVQLHVRLFNNLMTKKSQNQLNLCKHSVLFLIMKKVCK
jgi:hypothetical protein